MSLSRNSWSWTTLQLLAGQQDPWFLPSAGNTSEDHNIMCFYTGLGDLTWASMLVWQALYSTALKLLFIQKFCCHRYPFPALSLSMRYQLFCASGFCDISRSILESTSFSIALCTAKIFSYGLLFKTCSKVVVICSDFRIYINFHVSCSFGAF